MNMSSMWTPWLRMSVVGQNTRRVLHPGIERSGRDRIFEQRK